MEACLNYRSEYGTEEKLQFYSFEKSGSIWTLIQDGFFHGESKYQRIKIQKATLDLHRFYYADVEVYTDSKKLVLEKTRKGSWENIEVRIESNELSEALRNVSDKSDPKSHADKDSDNIKESYQKSPANNDPYNTNENVLISKATKDFDDVKEINSQSSDEDSDDVKEINSQSNDEDLDDANENLNSFQFNLPEALGIPLSYRIKLFPVLEFQNAEEMERRKTFAMQVFQSFVYDISKLIRDPALDPLYDVVIASDEIEIKAHKSVLSSRVPQFCDKVEISRPRNKKDRERQEETGLEMFRLNSSAASGLKDMVTFIYTNEYSTNSRVLRNLGRTAKEMGEVKLQQMFLHEQLSIDSVLYVIHATDVLKEKKYLVKCLSFLLSHFAQIVQTGAWVCLEKIFEGMWLANRKTCKPCTSLDILKMSLNMAVEICYE